MKIERLIIEKFRAIRFADVAVYDQVALVGQNSSGKSSILRALNAFFNFELERDSFERNQHSFFPTAFAVIDVSFSGAPAACTLPRVVAGGSDVRARLRYRKQAQWQIFTAGSWTAIAGPDLHEQLERYISYALVPTRRDHAIAAWGADGILEQAVEQAVSAARQRDNLTPRIQELSTRLQKQALDGLAKKLRKATPLAGSFEYVIETTTRLDYRVLMQDLSIRIREGSHSVGLSDAGSGNQSLAVFALYSYLAELKNSTYILGFEEPEQNLHPQAQTQLMAALKDTGLQVVFTTHSPTLIDALDHESVVLCRRKSTALREIEMEVAQLPSGFFASHGLTRDDYYRFHHRRNSEFFFADHVLVTESPIDSAVLSQIVIDAGIEDRLYALSRITLDGVAALPYVFHLLRQMGIPASYVIDRDYFLPYRNGSLDASRDARGYPTYAATMKTGTVSAALFSRKDLTTFASAIYSNFALAVEMLASVGFYCFRWSLEIDLVSTPSTRARLYVECGVPTAKQTERELLVERKNQIKKQDVLVGSVSAVDPGRLPRTYRYIRKALKELAT